MSSSSPRVVRASASGLRNSQRYFKDSESVVKLLAPPAKDRTLAKEKKKKKKGARAKVMAGR